MSINCKHWSDCEILKGGCCALGLYGGNPANVICNQMCKSKEEIAGFNAVEPLIAVEVKRSEKRNNRKVLQSKPCNCKRNKS